jgi:hypothetical protein
MRIAAGVLLIIAGVFNLFGGGGYVACGGASSAMGGAMKSGSLAEFAASGAQTEEDKEQIRQAAAANDAELKRAGSELSQAGGGMVALGLFLLVVFGLQIAGAVFLFKNSKKTFVLVVAGLTILAELLGIAVTAFGWTKAVGVVAGVLAIVAALSIGKEATAPPPPPPAAADV